MIAPMEQMVTVVEDEAEQAGSAAVLLKYVVNPVKELLGELKRLNNLCPCCSVGSPGG